MNGVKKKIMMHYVLPGATGGPNILFQRIENKLSAKDQYDFVHLNQHKVAGGKINIKLILELKKEIEKQNPDIIHISGMQSSGFHCMVAAVLAKCPRRLITTHGFSNDSLSIPKFKRVIFNQFIEPLTLYFATRVHAISQHSKNNPLVKKHAKNKVNLVYNFPPLIKERNSIINRKDLGLCDGDIVFTTVSRIVEDKGYTYLAEAILKTSHLENIKFLIVGDGIFLETFKNMVSKEILEKKVIIMGKTSNVMGVLNISDVFVLPTLHENLGNVFLEAAFSKIPSIGTNVGGVPEIIENNITGYLIPPRDSEELSIKIKEMYSNNDLRKTMGLEAYKKVEIMFNIEEISKKFENIYESMLSPKNNSKRGYL